MPAALRICADTAEGGTYVADRMLAAIDAAASEHRDCLLGIPTGRSPKPVIDALVGRLAAAPRDCSTVTLVLMDEYLVPGPHGLQYADAVNSWSCHAFAQTEVLARVNQVLPAGQHISAERIWCPDPSRPDAYDARLAAAGGVDLFLLASGASDGHVAFNPPGSPRDSRTRIIPISDDTRRDNLQTFPTFGTLEHVPHHGVSVGIDTLCASKAVIMVAWGASKQQTVARMRRATTYDSSWPATLVHECTSAEIVVDASASGDA